MRELTIIVAEYLIILSALGAIGVFFSVKSGDKKQFVIRLVIGGVLALAIAWLARKFYYDPRPFVAGHFTPWFPHAADNGFVSDHTLAASFLAATSYFYKKWVGVALLALAIGIGAARVYSGVHHWPDIISAIIISTVSALIAMLITQKLVAQKSKQSDVK